MQSGGDLWVQDTARPSFIRLTSEETVGNSYPVWTADGDRVVFRTRTGLRWIDANGGRSSQVIPGTAVTDFPSSVSPDGKLLAISRITADLSSNVDILQLDGNAQPMQLVRTAGFDGGAAFGANVTLANYDVSADGQRFVMVKDDPGSSRLNIVLNWFDELSRLESPSAR